MSFLLQKDRGQVPVVNGEEKEASPPSYPLGGTPWGTSCLRRPRHPQSCGPNCLTDSLRIDRLDNFQQLSLIKSRETHRYLRPGSDQTEVRIPMGSGKADRPMLA